jgi:hypothetical protein
VRREIRKEHKGILADSNSKAAYLSKILGELQSKNLLTVSESLHLKDILEMASSSCVPGPEMATGIRCIADSIIDNEDASPVAIALASIAADICTYCAAARNEVSADGRR